MVEDSVHPFQTHIEVLLTGADDIRTVTSSLATLQQQINTVQTFVTENALTLNISKCEVLLVSSSKSTSQAPFGTIGDQALAPRDRVKCLGYWWS